MNLYIITDNKHPSPIHPKYMTDQARSELIFYASAPDLDG